MDERETQAPVEREADLAAVGELAEARRTLLGEELGDLLGHRQFAPLFAVVRRRGNS